MIKVNISLVFENKQTGYKQLGLELCVKINKLTSKLLSE